MKEWQNLAPEQLRKGLIIPPELPDRIPCTRIGEGIDYSFELAGISIGWVGLHHNPAKRHITWNQFYPFALHPSPEEVKELPGVSEGLISQVGINFLMRFYAKRDDAIPLLEGKGLGVLAHLLVVRHLCKVVLTNPEAYTTSYFSAKSVAPRLIGLLQRTGIDSMRENPMAITDVRDRLLRYVEQQTNVS